MRGRNRLAAFLIVACLTTGAIYFDGEGGSSNSGPIMIEAPASWAPDYPDPGVRDDDIDVLTGIEYREDEDASRSPELEIWLGEGL